MPVAGPNCLNDAPRIFPNVNSSVHAPHSQLVALISNDIESESNIATIVARFEHAKAEKHLAARNGVWVENKLTLTAVNRLSPPGQMTAARDRTPKVFELPYSESA
ncbi:hypothetical protein ACVWZ6_002608 [Bradyrhizobium sp. GM6.1]